MYSLLKSSHTPLFIIILIIIIVVVVVAAGATVAIARELTFGRGAKLNTGAENHYQHYLYYNYHYHDYYPALARVASPWGLLDMYWLTSTILHQTCPPVGNACLFPCWLYSSFAVRGAR